MSASKDKKVFIGTWVSTDARTKLKVACANHGIYQGDVIELLILKWLRNPVRADLLESLEVETEKAKLEE